MATHHSIPRIWRRRLAFERWPGACLGRSLVVRRPRLKHASEAGGPRSRSTERHPAPETPPLPATNRAPRVAAADRRQGISLRATTQGRFHHTRRAARDAVCPEPRQPGVSGTSAMAAERRANGVSIRFSVVALALAGRGPGRTLSLLARAWGLDWLLHRAIVEDPTLERMRVGVGPGTRRRPLASSGASTNGWAAASAFVSCGHAAAWGLVRDEPEVDVRNIDII
jgi:hypothetical protein